MDESEFPEESFVCYFCKDFGEHDDCVGVPCTCECPDPKVRRFESEKFVESLDM